MGKSGSAAIVLRVLPSAKKLLAAIVASFDDSGAERSGWQWGTDTVAAWGNAAIYQMWRAWRDHGRLPNSGGWLDQPLAILAQIEAIETVYTTMSYKTSKDAKWENMTPLQLDIVRELNG